MAGPICMSSLRKKWASGGASQAVLVITCLPMQETGVRSLGQEDPLEEGMNTPVFLSGESHGQRSLVGYSPWGCKESGMTECLPGSPGKPTM